ncbi:response regulator [Bacillus sp. Marseille-P3661]|uniref:response regulator n=1 Tax=Bacillus sp. Marseille-P3661 TaxID=1936234 RepID=UPI000C82D9C8|nr:response regulator [Bacillus sp. Marseille-P3661]
MNNTILIADDSMFMRTYLKNIVLASSFEVISEASNGAEAIDKYKEFSPDIVLLDITMPKINGLEALKAIRNIDPIATVIMCSAMGQQYLITEALRAGAHDFVIKPYFENLVSILKKYHGDSFHD